MRALRKILVVGSSLLALLTAGCAGTVVDSGPPNGEAPSGATGATEASAGPTVTPPPGGTLYGAAWGDDFTVSRIDAATGLHTEIAGFGYLTDWMSEDLVVDETGSRVLFIGGTDQGTFIYAADVVAGAAIAVPFPEGAYLGGRLAGVTQDGSLLIVSATSAADTLYRVDVTTGDRTVLGDIAPSNTTAFGGTPTYDHAAHVVYVIGETTPSYLYSYSLDTMTSASTPVTSLPSDFIVLAGVLPGGHVVGAFRDLDTSVARVVEIDPATGMATAAGQLSPDWQTGASLNAGVVRNYGTTGTETAAPQPQLFGLDLATHAFSEVPVSDQFVIARY